jgi:uncharacterized membrane protein
MISNFALSIGNPVLIVSLFVAGTVAIYLFKRRLSGEVEEERIYQVSQKASWVTYQIVVLSFAIGGLVLIAMRNYRNEKCLPYVYRPWHFHGSFGLWDYSSLCLLYLYYNREYGG